MKLSCSLTLIAGRAFLCTGMTSRRSPIYGIDVPLFPRRNELTPQGLRDLCPESRDRVDTMSQCAHAARETHGLRPADVIV